MAEPAREANGEVASSFLKGGGMTQEIHAARRRQQQQPEIDAPYGTSSGTPDDEGLAKRARITSTINRLMDMPVDILDRVLDIAVTSERFSWHPPQNYSHDSSLDSSLEKAVGKLFDWPSTIEPEKRRTLNQRAALTFLQMAIIELPSYFGLQESHAKLLDAPRALQERRGHVRRLVLDVWIYNSDHAEQYFLQKTMIGIDGLKAQFPQLRVCVISFRFKHGDKSRPSAFPGDLLWRRFRPCHAEGFVPYPRESVWELLVKLINVFAKRGPGTHKYIRFWNQSAKGERHAVSHIGPLVEVQPDAEIGPDIANVGPSLGERLLERAYRFLRKGECREV